MDPIEARIAAAQEAAKGRERQLFAELPRAASLLRARGAQQVWLFGSLARGQSHIESDVDLLVSGLPGEAWAETWSGLEVLLDTSVDLVRAEEASPSLLASARHEGMDITMWGKPDVAR